MKKIILSIMVLCVSGSVSAQTRQEAYKVFFATDKYVLDRADSIELDKVVLSSKNYTYCEIDLRAHTDFVGSKGYNETLSSNRAASVRKYLVDKGVHPEMINLNWYGENKPAATNGNEIGKQKNRRVEIVLKGYTFKDVNELLQQTKGNYEQSFTLKDKGAQTISGKKGTKVSIPEAAFILPDGRTVENDEVTMKLEEFQSVTDAIFNGLSTQSKGKILESGGMLKVTASYKGEELTLKGGKELGIELPSKNMQTGMSVFTGTANEDGIIEWEDTKKSFAVGKPNKNAGSKVDTNKLKTYYQPLPEKPMYIEADLRLNFPTPPQIMKKPYKPTLPLMPDSRRVVHGFKKLFTTKAQREQIARKKFNVKMKSYYVRLERYEKKTEVYDLEIAKHSDKIDQYYAELQVFDKKVDSLLNMFVLQAKLFDEYYDVLRLNSAIDRLIRLANDQNFVAKDEATWLYNKSLNYLACDISQCLNELYGRISFLGAIKASPPETVQKYYVVGGALSYTKYKIPPVRYHYIANEVASETLKKDLRMASMKNAADRSNRTSQSASMVENIYYAAVTGMGYINCDRFIETPPALMANINIEHSPDVRVVAYIGRLNSLLYATRKHGQSQLSVPLREKVTIITMKVDNKKGNPMFEKLVITPVEKKMDLQANPRPVKVSELISALASL